MTKNVFPRSVFPSPADLDEDQNPLLGVLPESPIATTGSIVGAAVKFFEKEPKDPHTIAALMLHKLVVVGRIETGRDIEHGRAHAQALRDDIAHCLSLRSGEDPTATRSWAIQAVIKASPFVNDHTDEEHPWDA